jgi:methyl-accepting chemotaxis protein
VDQFLHAMASTDERERRLYERMPGRGTMALLRAPGRAELRAAIQDISRGGLALRCSWTDDPGSEIQVVLPNTEAAASARVIRAANGVVGLAFRQDATTLALVDQAVRHIQERSMQAAA